ncbi:MAG: 2Fe-2S iron-sulfur cluster-binding protein [Desulfobacterales bacterium]
MIHITIDGKEYKAEAKQSLMEVLKANGIRIPTLCYHPALKPSGSCKLCAVEVPGRTAGRELTMLACTLRVEEGMEIRTTGQLVERARNRAFANLLQMAPQAEAIVALAQSFGVDVGSPPDGCIRCRLCIRVCEEIVGPGALKMQQRNGRNFVVPIENRCIGCGTCANICPTRVIKVEDRDNVRTISIRDEVIGKHPLERCEGCGRLFATSKFLDHIHRRTVAHPDVKTHHQYCPTCAKLFSDRIKSVGDRFRR